MDMLQSRCSFNIQIIIQKFSRCLKNNLNKERNQNSHEVNEKENKKNPQNSLKKNQKKNPRNQYSPEEVQEGMQID